MTRNIGGIDRAIRIVAGSCSSLPPSGSAFPPDRLERRRLDRRRPARDRADEALVPRGLQPIGVNTCHGPRAPVRE